MQYASDVYRSCQTCSAFRRRQGVAGLDRCRAMWRLPPPGILVCSKPGWASPMCPKKSNFRQWPTKAHVLELGDRQLDLATPATARGSDTTAGCRCCQRKTETAFPNVVNATHRRAVQSSSSRICGTIARLGAVLHDVLNGRMLVSQLSFAPAH